MIASGNGQVQEKKLIMELNDNTENEFKTVDLCVKELEEMYSTPRVGKELLCSYYWMGSLRKLKDFVKSLQGQVKGSWLSKNGTAFQSENDKVLINCKYDKAKKRWTLNFTNCAECNAFKNKLFDKFGSCEFLKSQLCMNWHSTFVSLKSYLSKSLQLEAEAPR